MIRDLTSRFSRFGRNVVGLLSTHVRLAGLELQDEMERILGHLIWLLAAATCAAVVVFLCVTLVIVLFWEQRVFAIIALIGFFLFFCTLLGGVLWFRLQRATPPFSRLADEIELDSQMLASQTDDKAEKTEQEKAHYV